MSAPEDFLIEAGDPPPRRTTDSLLFRLMIYLTIGLGAAVVSMALFIWKSDVSRVLAELDRASVAHIRVHDRLNERLDEIDKRLRTQENNNAAIARDLAAVSRDLVAISIDLEDLRKMHNSESLRLKQIEQQLALTNRYLKESKK